MSVVYYYYYTITILWRLGVSSNYRLDRRRFSDHHGNPRLYQARISPGVMETESRYRQIGRRGRVGKRSIQRTLYLNGCTRTRINQKIKVALFLCIYVYRYKRKRPALTSHISFGHTQHAEFFFSSRCGGEIEACDCRNRYYPRSREDCIMRLKRNSAFFLSLSPPPTVFNVDTRARDVRVPRLLCIHGISCRGVN